jgi:myo-inositol-1(or 4)-monophosphatase
MLQTTLLEAVHAGAAQLQYYFTREFRISEKEGINNLVTEADHAAEKAIIEVIQRVYPDHSILGEESGAQTTASDIQWIIDPIDGTVNFANHIPICAVSIGVEKAGEIILGAVYNPLMNELFVAEKGKGATLNGQPIRVTDKSNLAKSCLVTGFPYQYVSGSNDPMEVVSRLVKAGIPIRRLGSAAIDLCWVAAGRFDGFFEHHLEAWDSAAGFLIVAEAGGRVTDFEGQPFSPHQPRIIATNGHIHDALRAVIHGGAIEGIINTTA